MKRLEYAKNQVILHVTDRTPLDMKKVLKLVKEDKGQIKLLPDGRIVIRDDQATEGIVDATRNILMRLVAV